MFKESQRDEAGRNQQGLGLGLGPSGYKQL